MSEHTLFQRKQETIFEKDVIGSQFTLPAFCYGVCACVSVCVYVCMRACVCVSVARGHTRVPIADLEHSFTTFTGDSLSTKTVVCVCFEILSFCVMV